MSPLILSRNFLASLCAVACTLASLCGADVAQAGTNSWTSTGPEGGMVNVIGWHPTRAGVVIAVSGGRIFRSTDSGSHWAPASPNVSAGGNVAFDPTNPDRILVGGQPVMRSVDGGATFSAAPTLPFNTYLDSLAIALDGSVLAVSGGKIYRSSDFAQSWTLWSTVIASTDSGAGIRISPADPTTIYVGFSHSGLFKSTNGGSTWTAITSLPGSPDRFALDPNNAQRLLVVAGNTLWRSIDGGASWSASAPGFFFFVDYDPRTVNRVVAGGISQRQLFISSDGGGSWLPAAPVPSAYGITGAISPQAPGVIAVGTTEGVYISDDAGVSTHFSSSGIVASELLRIAVSRSAPYRIYASFLGGPEGVFIRGSAGDWQATDVSGLYTALGTRTAVAALAVDPNDPLVVYAGGMTSMARSTTGGAAWSLKWNDGNAYYLEAIAVDPSNTQILYMASTSLGILRSADGGATWAPRNNGLPVVSGKVPFNNIFVDPADPQRLYAKQESTAALYRSSDAGLNWARVAGGLPANEGVVSVTFDPLIGNRVYVGTNGELYRSNDGGLTWAVVQTPIGTQQVFSVLIDPMASNVITLASASNLPGVVRTVDSGATWERVPWDSGANGSTGPMLGALDPSQPGNLIIGGRFVGVREFQIAPDLSISITAPTSPVQSGTTSSLRFIVQNNVASQFAASDATLSVSVPATLTPGTITTSRGSCTRNGPSISCTLGAMKIGETAQIDVAVTAGVGTGTVSAAVQPRELDASTSDNSATAQVTALPYTDLRATVTAPASADHGAAATVTTQVVNLGPDGAFNTRVAITLPAGLALSSAFSSGVCTVSASIVTCQLGSLPANANATVTLPVTGTIVGAQSVSATVTSGSFDPAAGNNTASATISVKPVADLALTLSNVSASVVAGQSGTAKVTLTNNGSDAVSAVLATLSGTRLSVTAGTFSGGTCTVASGTASCAIGALAAGASKTIDLSFGTSTSGSALLTGTISSEGSDGTTGNNTDSAAIDVKPVADLAIAFSNVSVSVLAGQNGTATATVTNNGPDPINAGTATVSGTGLTLTAGTFSGGTCTIASGSASCTVGALSAGASKTIDLTFSTTTAGSAQLNGSTSSEVTDGTAGNNTVSGAVSVTAPASPPSSNNGGSSGGGGSLGIWPLALLSMAVLRRRTVFCGLRPWRATDAPLRK